MLGCAFNSVPFRLFLTACEAVVRACIGNLFWYALSVKSISFASFFLTLCYKITSMKCLYEIWRDAFDIENENLLDLHVSGVKPDSVPIAIL